MGHRKFKVADENHSNKLFDEPYRATDSRHFSIPKSSTFVAQASQTFDLNYADGSHLRGFSGVDQVFMGNYKATSPFGVITDCNSPDFNGVDGILGAYTLPPKKKHSGYPFHPRMKADIREANMWNIVVFCRQVSAFPSLAVTCPPLFSSP
jgi:hypothetical protein